MSSVKKAQAFSNTNVVSYHLTPPPFSRIVVENRLDSFLLNGPQQKEKKEKKTCTPIFSLKIHLVT